MNNRILIANIAATMIGRLSPETAVARAILLLNAVNKRMDHMDVEIESLALEVKDEGYS